MCKSIGLLGFSFLAWFDFKSHTLEFFFFLRPCCTRATNQFAENIARKTARLNIAVLRLCAIDSLYLAASLSMEDDSSRVQKSWVWKIGLSRLPRLSTKRWERFPAFFKRCLLVGRMSVLFNVFVLLFIAELGTLTFFFPIREKNVLVLISFYKSSISKVNTFCIFVKKKKKKEETRKNFFILLKAVHASLVQVKMARKSRPADISLSRRPFACCWLLAAGSDRV